MKTLEFFYDFSCPYAYLASTRIERLAKAGGAELVYKPFLLGGVFNALGVTPMQMPEPKSKLNQLDMKRWADHWGVPLVMPEGHPNRTVLALRAALASKDLPKATRALFDAYWAEGRDLSDPPVVVDALNRAGLDGATLVERAEDPAIKAELRERTDEAIARGVFGAPTMFVDDELYWGQDRLHLVARVLGGEALAALAPHERGPDAEKAKSFDFYFDFSSPYAYLGAVQVEALSKATGAEAVWKPFFLGGLFKGIGGPLVPIATVSEPKRRHYIADLERHARLYRAPYRFPSRFPMNTLTALRLSIAAQQAGLDVAKLNLAIFRAYWAEDRDISQIDELRRICKSVGIDSDLVARAEESAIKDALRALTDEALARGLCGAPSFVVDGEVFWGQDRIGFVERAIQGWRAR